MYWFEQFIHAGLSDACWIALAAYAIGCFSTGYYLVRCLRGTDLRTLGSGNLGARNAGRILGWRGFVITLLGDFGKGALAVWMAREFTSEQWMWFVAIVGVVIGHIWPVQLRFSGGKGVAASLGALLVYDYRLAFAYVALFGAGYAILRTSTLPGLIAFAILPWASFCFENRTAWTGFAEVVGLFLLAAIVLLAHRRNLAEQITLLRHKRPCDAPINPPKI